MSDIKDLSPEDSERLFAELSKDPKFQNTRYALLIFSVIGGVGLFAAGWLMINNKLSLLDVVTAIVVFVFVNVWLVNRLNTMKKAVLDRWKREDPFRQIGT